MSDRGQSSSFRRFVLVELSFRGLQIVVDPGINPGVPLGTVACRGVFDPLDLPLCDHRRWSRPLDRPARILIPHRPVDPRSQFDGQGPVPSCSGRLGVFDHPFEPVGGSLENGFAFTSRRPRSVNLLDRRGLGGLPHQRMRRSQCVSPAPRRFGAGGPPGLLLVVVTVLDIVRLSPGFFRDRRRESGGIEASRVGRRRRKLGTSR